MQTIFCHLMPIGCLCSNVIGALGLTQHPLVAHLMLLIKEDRDKLSTQVDFMPGICLYTFVCISVCIVCASGM